MSDHKNEIPRRILIASANPLFGKGLRSLFQRWGGAAEIIGLATNMQQTLQALEHSQPDLVIVDYDDRSMDREEFLNHFVASERPMQVMLVSLQGPGAVVVYDRRTLSASQAVNWLGGPWFSSIPSERSNQEERGD